jgi:hypothetical protein
MFFKKATILMLVSVITICVGVICTTIADYVLNCTEYKTYQYEYDSAYLTHDRYGNMRVNAIVKMKDNNVYYTRLVSTQVYKLYKKGDMIFLKERVSNVVPECIDSKMPQITITALVIILLSLVICLILVLK